MIISRRGRYCIRRWRNSPAAGFGRGSPAGSAGPSGVPGCGCEQGFMGFHRTRPAVGANGKREADALAGKGFDGCGSERRSAMFQRLRSERLHRWPYRVSPSERCSDPRERPSGRSSQTAEGQYAQGQCAPGPDVQVRPPNRVAQGMGEHSACSALRVVWVSGPLGRAVGVGCRLRSSPLRARRRIGDMFYRRYVLCGCPCCARRAAGQRGVGQQRMAVDSRWR